MKIIVSGMIAAHPHQGGATWAVLQYVLGLRALGHETCFVESVDDREFLPPGGPFHESTNVRYFRDVVEKFGLGASAAIVRRGTLDVAGMSYAELQQVIRSADVLLNLSGTLSIDELTAHIPVRIYLDLDPAFTQFWHAQGLDVGFEGHTHFFTIGQSVGQANCSILNCGIEWETTLQPIVLAHWPFAAEVASDSLTTIGNWRGYGSVEYDGVFYGQKAHSLRPFLGLPEQTNAGFLLAMSIHPDERRDLEQLAQNGWKIVNPLEVAGTPQHYQQFIQHSWAEFGIAKSGYVVSRSGWFSDRSICYLASGKPVIAQDTGFSDYLPTGEGLFAFQSNDEVRKSIQCISNDYARHAKAARNIAEEYFDSAKVLSRVLEVAGCRGAHENKHSA